MNRDKIKNYIKSLLILFLRVIRWTLFSIFWVLGFGIAIAAVSEFGWLQGGIPGIIIAAVCIFTGFMIAIAFEKLIERINPQIDEKTIINAEKKTQTNSRIVFAGKTYLSFDDLMYNYFNSEPSASDINEKYKYGIEFKDKYNRDLYVYVDTPPCFDAADFLYTPKFYYVFYIKGNKLCGLYADSISGVYMIDNNVKELPKCEYTSGSLLEMMKQDGFFEGHTLTRVKGL